ncbi:MAG: PD40 domain-containing protein [Candidatus Heimdallarchaeota archaeon]|nr:PD40 domain-containing protein [Candidatus Heimdallarchaeota archaeon]
MLISNFKTIEADQYFNLEPPIDDVRPFNPVFMDTPHHVMACSYCQEGDVFTFTVSTKQFTSKELWMLRKKNDSWIVENVISSGSYGAFHPIEQRLYFDKMNEEKILGIHYLEDSNEIPLLSVNTDAHTGYPNFNAKGDMYFHSNRSIGLGSFDFYKAVYNNGKYEEIVNLGSMLNDNDRQYHPFITPDDKLLLFDSPDIPNKVGRQDMYCSINENGWKEPILLNINSSSADYRGIITPDEQYIIFCSDRDGKQALYWASWDYIKDKSGIDY